MKTCFSEGKLTKQFGNPPLSKRIPLSTNPLISEQLFHEPPLCPNFKNKTPPPNFRGGGGGEETMHIYDEVFYLEPLVTLKDLDS